jgi:hypothetical protein
MSPWVDGFGSDGACPSKWRARDVIADAACKCSATAPVEPEERVAPAGRTLQQRAELSEAVQRRDAVRRARPAVAGAVEPELLGEDLGARDAALRAAERLHEARRS